MLEGVAGVIGRASESLGVKLLRFLPSIRIMMQGINWNDNLRSCRNVDAIVVVIISTFTIHKRSRWVQAEGFFYDAVEILDGRDYLIEGTFVFAGLYGCMALWLTP